MATLVGTLGVLPSLTIGGRVFTDLTNIIMLIGSSKTGALNCTGRKAGATSGYQVTAGKTLTISAIKMQSETTTAWGCYFNYSDNDVGYSTSTALTNGVVLAPLSSSFALEAPATVGGIGNFEVSIAVIAAKYLTSIQIGTGTGDWIAYGYEA